MDTEWEPLAGGTTRRSDELARYLHDGRIDSARRLVSELLDTGSTDEALEVLARLAPTRPEALELLLEALEGSGVVRRFAGAALLDPAAVEDVAQDSLISIAQSIGGYDHRAKVTTWVHTIVRRRVADHLRRQRETVELHEQHRPAARMSSLIADRVTVRQLLAELPELYRIPVELRDLDQLSYKDIAARLGRSVGTVKSQISRGRAMLAGRLGTESSALAARPRPGLR
ncbi:MAG: RNA polymerase sigma factor [Brachybacterium sp.]|uniref:RNA polymerase sigma factor n=1 Tax=unclassified Brachybacterium TaxID=2623841 RepID=UPI003F9AD50C